MRLQKGKSTASTETGKSRNRNMPLLSYKCNILWYVSHTSSEQIIQALEQHYDAKGLERAASVTFIFCA